MFPKTRPFQSSYPWSSALPPKAFLVNPMWSSQIQSVLKTFWIIPYLVAACPCSTGDQLVVLIMCVTTLPIRFLWPRLPITLHCVHNIQQRVYVICKRNSSKFIWEWMYIWLWEINMDRWKKMQWLWNTYLSKLSYLTIAVEAQGSALSSVNHGLDTCLFGSGLLNETGPLYNTSFHASNSKHPFLGIPYSMFLLAFYLYRVYPIMSLSPFTIHLFTWIAIVDMELLLA